MTISGRAQNNSTRVFSAWRFLEFLHVSDSSYMFLSFLGILVNLDCFCEFFTLTLTPCSAILAQ